MRVAVVGVSGHAKVVLDILERQGEHEVVCCAGREGPGEFRGYRVWSDDDLPELARRGEVEGVVCAIGDNWVRSRVVAALRERSPELRWPPAIHPSAQIGRGVEIGEGAVVMAGAVVNPDSVVGPFAIVNTLSSVDHDSRVGAFAAVAPGAVTGGGVRLGDYAVLSLGCRVKHQVTIGEHTVVGAGAVVLADLPAYVVAYGVPARVIRSRVAGERYL